MRGFALVAVTLATASCSWLQSLEKDPTLDWSADQLYTEARSALDDSNWTQAKDYYQKLEARYPFGQYAQQAQIELIYATWKDGDAPGAVQAADQFLRTYPNHANSDYVMYLKALATLNETDSWFNKLAAEDLAERDPNASREAFDTFKELALRYPDSRFAPEARRRMHGLVLAQAEHELKTAQYYFARHAYVAAIERAQRVVREFQNTPMRDDALQLIADSYDALKISDLATDTRRIIDMNRDGARAQPAR
ncbi:outer membrane protein assembly factor BamD [Sutterella sp.]|uniref:outer membrane protein assembly factor BamD n=1 Tax=Sutterella sp. TaxID=1981025 RepID=UPI0026E0A9DC|nr:outer membrane protein assembly factor BamD [Sutterella sp.]MDO5532011.1 outer membrane protein assembly factor BamD [Sutterella sp.]